MSINRNLYQLEFNNNEFKKRKNDSFQRNSISSGLMQKMGSWINSSDYELVFLKFLF